MKKLVPSNPFRELYDEAKLPQYLRRSLTFVIISNVFGTLCGIICGTGTTAMVGLATSMGADDLFFGILTAISQVFVLMQIPYSLLVNRTRKRKKYMLTLGLLSRIMWLFFGFIPVLLPATVLGPMNLQLWALVFLIGIICLSGNVISVCWLPWLTDMCPQTIMSRWLALRDIILQTFTVLFGFGVALLLDYLPIEIRYKIVFLLGGTVGILDMLCFSFCRDESRTVPKKLDVVVAFRHVLQDRKFMPFLVFWTVWSFIRNFGDVYIAPYVLNVMEVSNLQFTLFFTITAAVSAIFVMPHWGRAIHHYGQRHVMLIGCIGASLSSLLFVFCAPGKNVVPLFLRNFLGAWFWCGCNLAATNIYLTQSPEEERPSYIAIYSCITSMVGGVLGSLGGGAFLKFMANRGLFTGWFDRYKMLFVVEAVFSLVFTLIFVPKISNESPKSMRDLWDAILRIRRRFGRRAPR